jgi:hypothetical protein
MSWPNAVGRFLGLKTQSTTSVAPQSQPDHSILHELSNGTLHAWSDNMIVDFPQSASIRMAGPYTKQKAAAVFYIHSKMLSPSEGTQPGENQPWKHVTPCSQRLLKLQPSAV